jgi:hypothetical protein
MLMNRPSKPDRRRFLLNSGMLAAAWLADAALTQELAPTPSCHDGDGPTVSETEGPFFKPRSPERSDLREPGVRGRQFELSGVVLSRSRVITGPDGAFCFRTIVPALYSGARGTTTSRFKRSAAVY